MIRVLIADDSPIIRTSLAKSVEQISDTIVLADMVGNGIKALEWLELNYADVCITDIRMPAMDGLTLIKHINDRFPWMVNMVVSSYDDFEYAKMSIELNATDYIMKPVEDKLLGQALQRAEERLVKDRTRLAAQVLLRYVPRNRKMVENWLEHIRSHRLETLPLLIVDTLGMLEEWVEGKWYLLNTLSNMWLQLVIDELGSGSKHAIQLDEGKDLGLGEGLLPISQIRFYFRLCAVRRLEEGAYKLMAAVGEGRSYANSRMIENVKRYVREHCHEDINLQTMADYVELNKSYMSTLFKQETNMTLWNYIVAERMNMARNLLLDSNRKIYEIANHVGYDDISYFAQLFKKHYGLTPLDYKKRMEH